MLQLSGDPQADQLLSDDPLALLIGMVLDQQIPLERAFSSPRDLQERLGGQLDAGTIASMDHGKLAAIFAERPALHRFPASNAERVQQLCRIIVKDYGGDPARIWEGATTGAELLRRVKALPGFGDQKAKIFVALLGKQLGVRPSGWQDVSRPFGDPGTHLSVADITDADSLARVRAHKSQLKAAAKAAKLAAGTA
ncbi:MAG TPA: HhH-GPD-type base excision DNA repair protein [Acidimicrobiales bacterium]|nr:HhH-GPD-type base excision DNA repair protein [Acidimicrobiales bacterium]